MIDPHLGVPVDQAYREETARLLERLMMPCSAYFCRVEEDAEDFRCSADIVRMIANGARTRRWSFLSAAHRLEQIARSLEET